MPQEGEALPLSVVKALLANGLLRLLTGRLLVVKGGLEHLQVLVPGLHVTTAQVPPHRVSG